uniref:Uncharacterized protein n=1 Tax=Romanomermis culicivorax TaxID=13658 RepID=A0A915IKX6_ROMCU
MVSQTQRRDCYASSREARIIIAACKIPESLMQIKDRKKHEFNFFCLFLDITLMGFLPFSAQSERCILRKPGKAFSDQLEKTLCF